MSVCPKCARNSLKEEYRGHFRCKVCNWIGPAKEAGIEISEEVQYRVGLWIGIVVTIIMMEFGLIVVMIAEGYVTEADCAADAREGLEEQCVEAQRFLLLLFAYFKIVIPILSALTWFAVFAARAEPKPDTKG